MEQSKIARVCHEVNRAYCAFSKAAHENVESSQHIHQQTNGAEPSEICPNCGWPAERVGIQSVCHSCRLTTLKAEIAALANDLGDHLSGMCVITAKDMYYKLRQLSSV